MLHFESYVVCAALVGVLLRIGAIFLPSRNYKMTTSVGTRYPGKRVPFDR